MLKATYSAIARILGGGMASRPKACLTGVVQDLGSSLLSCVQLRSKDSAESSNAGAFLSIPNVNPDELEQAVRQVISAYGEAHDTDEVLIQPMLTEVVRSGVAFSHDPNTCAPYRVVNWSEGSDTAEVTGGLGGRIWQQAADSTVTPMPILAPVVGLLDELLSLFGDVPLDCEFAVTRSGSDEVLWLLQASIGLSSTRSHCGASRSLFHRNKVAWNTATPFLMGRRTVYGVMPD